MAGVRESDILTQFELILYVNLILIRSMNLMKERDFKRKKSEAETITDIDNTYYRALLTNTPAQAES